MGRMGYMGNLSPPLPSICRARRLSCRGGKQKYYTGEIPRGAVLRKALLHQAFTGEP